MSNQEANDHSDLRRRLQDEASAIKIGLSPGEVDWFLRPNHFSSLLQPIRSPSHADSNTAKSPASVTTTNATVSTGVVNSTTSPLSRSKTTEGNYAGSHSAPSKYDTSALKRTASNVADSSKPKTGFFKKLLGKRAEKPVSSSPIPAHRLSIANPEPSKLEPTFDHSAQSTADKAPASHVDPKLSHYLEEIHSAASGPSSRDSSSSSTIFEEQPKGSLKLDAAGNPIPPHPAIPKLPSAFVDHPKYSVPPSPQCQPFQPEKPTVFGSLLGRRRTLTDLSRVPSPTQPQSPPTQHAMPVKCKKTPPIKLLKDMKPMKRVAFATTVFVNDPPQQIPSRTPRKGNVEVNQDGTIIVHKILPEERLQAAAGIVVGGSGHLRLMDHPGSPPPGAEVTNNMVLDSTPPSPAPERTDHDAPEPKSKFETGVKIDKPMVKRHSSSPAMNKPLVTLKLDELYTRCCHLREILPIPATLKQIPKGSTDPLLYMQLRNPKPSMIEVLAFSDFIRIAPLTCLSLDGVSLTEEMFRTILSALVSKRYFEKLSLRNTPMNAEGWKLLCWFLSMNKVVKQLDITQCPSLSTNTQKARSGSKSNTKVMECNSQDRSDMDWPLLTATLIARGGIGSIVLSGCKINDLEVFENFMDMALSISTRNVGLAYNDLSPQHCEIVARWLKNNLEVLGLDLGYNNIGNSLKPFIEYTKETVSTSKLALLSLNCTGLFDSPDVRNLTSTLSQLQNFRYLDLSNNPKLFPAFTTPLATFLPLYTKLARLHLDNNELTPGPLISLAETLPLCKSLTYLSIVGNHLDESTCIAICQGLKNSQSLFTIEFNEDEMPGRLKEKIGLYTMRNMERALYGSTSVTDNNFFVQSKGLIKQGEKSLTETMAEFLHDKDLDSEKAQTFLEETGKVRESIHETMTELFKLQHKNKLNMDGKETLVRLCVIDASLERGMSLIDSKIQNLYKSTIPSKIGIPAERGDARDGPADGITDADNTMTEIKGEDASSSSLDEPRTSLRSKDRAEGSTLRLSSLAEKKDADPWNISNDTIAHALLEASDIKHVAKILQSLKAKGVSLRDLFGKGSETSNGDDITTLRDKLHNLEQSKEDDLSDTDSIDSAEPDYGGRDDLQAVSAAYDQLLDQFQKIKTADEES
ncbi:unnamed protein product [Kuraishia capsulata CBS 1993]|uniref:RNI-like protein n=1 Tax=Kuraishia capsulata CBS 1993 TaxID=1382522 RepID=W6MHY9_9ASCO|nr:uncharacterized protein KUCA_T00001960001 [Kuraishia capsulata CBS 1993]CDK25989.1 unnamed protein product [Kuraishia capsulata CBS 1993]